MASDVLEKAIALAPGQTHYRKQAALAHFHLGQFEETIEDLRVRVEASPNDASSIVWIAPDLVAGCQDDSFRTELLKLSERLFELSDRKQRVLYDRGWILLQCGEPDKANQCLDEAVEFTPDNPEFLKKIGLLYANKGMAGESTQPFFQIH